MSDSSRIVLDTSAYAHLRGGDERVGETIAIAGTVHLSVITLGELEAGFELGHRPAENRARLTEFLAAPFVSVLPITKDVARIYGRIFAQLRWAGTPIGLNDIWIAACAIDSGAQVITFDADFERITGLDLLLLRP